LAKIGFVKLDTMPRLLRPKNLYAVF